jgi:hypothetical protein
LIIKNGCMAHKPVPIALQKSWSKCVIVKYGFMAHKPVPIALQKSWSKCVIIKNFEYSEKSYGPQTSAYRATR